MPLIPGQRGRNIGTGIARAMQIIGTIGDPRMQAGLLNQWSEDAEQRQRLGQYTGLLDNMSSAAQPTGGILDMGGGVSAQPITHTKPQLTETQRGILGALPPEQGLGLLAQRAFGGQERQIPGRDVPYSPEVLEQQMMLRGRGEGEGVAGPDIGTFNPRDYTADSFAKFMESGDPNDLKRYQRYKQVGGQLWDMEQGVPVADVTGALRAGSAATTEGGKIGEARANIPQVETDATRALETIRKLRTHPGRKYAHGVASLVPAREGTPEYEFRRLHDQAKGEVFLSAYQRLKGGGHITEIETQQAEKALARLDLGLERGDYNKALSDLERVIKAGLAREKRKARGGGQQATQAPLVPPAPTPQAPVSGGPQPGTVEDGYRFKGGDPSDPDSWERVQ